MASGEENRGEKSWTAKGPPAPPRDSHPFDRLVSIMALLRGERGCPWDRVQTFASLKPHVVEEAYEVVEAIEKGPDTSLREELGDLLFMIVFLAQLAREEGLFSAHELAEVAARKMIRRHPHVFRGEGARTPGEVMTTWEHAKRRERQEKKGSILDGLPRSLPALQRAQRLQERASAVGFDWEGPEPVAAKVREELAELEEALGRGDSRKLAEELGDLIFAAVNLARLIEVDAEETLRQATEKFRRRFARIEGELGRRGEKLDLAAMDRIWEEAKREEEG